MAIRETDTFFLGFDNLAAVTYYFPNIQYKSRVNWYRNNMSVHVVLNNNGLSLDAQLDETKRTSAPH